MAGVILFLALVALFLILGIMLSRGKWSFLIAGFNVMSKEEKEKYDELALCKFMGKFMFIIAFSMSLLGLSEVLKMKILFDAGVTFLIVSTIFVVIYTNTSNRFEKKK
ncbi:MAG: DUF3784 domain-containing protein [Clostridium sp.]|uniref:DUF3784 domain-containing protein n=1 Tax=Clostridium sp. DSM 8431 TaxID=1761781 RepID=UPI0008E75B5D|nr:DUF3784 domain-containing protein [Clostridium sp. DSM 8431]MCR4944577.1 DUF3784 domain-containing protein [Clostridium sp.]SFU33266.1 protein of unknown function [Clostridium sp. DSM 8431]